MRKPESCRKMPGFALSRRQRGFESLWGHKIKPPLTRIDFESLPDTEALSRRERKAAL
jgi:hypothetical protein